VEGHDVICEANNSAELSGAFVVKCAADRPDCRCARLANTPVDMLCPLGAGLLTVLHGERHGEGLNPTNLPLLSEQDESALR
jgi:hypothetical protein